MPLSKHVNSMKFTQSSVTQANPRSCAWFTRRLLRTHEQPV